MTHEEFTGVTFNDLFDPSETRISKPSFFIVISTEITINIQSAYFYLNVSTWRYGICYRKIRTLPVVCSLSLTFVCLTQGIEHWSLRQYSSPLCNMPLWVNGRDWCTCFCVQVLKTLDYPTVNINLKCTVWMITMHARPKQTDRTEGQTDRQTDANIVAIAR